MKRNVSVVHLTVATWNSGPPASGNIIKEMLGSVASGTHCIHICHVNIHSFSCTTVGFAALFILVTLNYNLSHGYLKRNNGTGIYSNVFQYIVTIMPQETKLRLNSDLQLGVSKSSNVILQIILKFHQLNNMPVFLMQLV